LASEGSSEASAAAAVAQSASNTLVRMSRHEIHQRLKMVAESRGLRVMHGYAKKSSQVARSLSRINETVWQRGGNYMPYNYFRKCIKNPNLFVVAAFAVDSKQKHPCCLLACYFAGRKRRSQSQNAVIALLWTQAEYRRRGYATLTMDCMSPFLLDGTVLQSGFNDSPPAIAFYNTNRFNNINIGTSYSISAEQLRADAIGRSLKASKVTAEKRKAGQQHRRVASDMHMSDRQQKRDHPKRSRAEIDSLGRQAKRVREESERGSTNEKSNNQKDVVRHFGHRAWEFCWNLLGWKGDKT
jgi:hypothetical protein